MARVRVAFTSHSSRSLNCFSNLIDHDHATTPANADGEKQFCKLYGSRVRNERSATIRRGGRGCFRGILIRMGRPRCTRPQFLTCYSRPVLGERAFGRGQSGSCPQVVQPCSPEGPHGCNSAPARSRRDDVRNRDRDGPTGSSRLDERGLGVLSVEGISAGANLLGHVAYTSRTAKDSVACLTQYLRL